MKLLTFRTCEGTQAGRLDGDRVTALPAGDLGHLMSRADWLETVRSAHGKAYDYEELELGPPVLRPGKIVCLGLNYATHITEMGREPPSHPTLFAKFAGTLTGPHDPIVLPAISQQIDWEAELAFVIGRIARAVDDETARASIAGYTVLNDISMRDWQGRTTQWLQGKVFESTTPVGPVLVTPDEVDHAADLEVRCEIDGRMVQLARTSDLVFKPEQIVSYISSILTLHPGDLIATGTPGGVGVARSPQVFLTGSETMLTSIEGIGELVNRCTREVL